MKILELKPKIELQKSCCYCATTYILEEPDVTVKIDFVCGRVNLECHDFLGAWSCPGCGKAVSTWLYELPWSWRDAIKARSPGIDAEFDTLKKAEKEREARCNVQPKLPRESGFDKFLRGFIFRK